MADTDDALKHFITSNDDPYTLLDLPNGPASTDKEIRSAWKKTALKFHPDKIRAKDDVDEATANQIYILRQDAYGILSEPHLREHYDNALRAKEQKKQRDAAFTGKRKAMKEDLERRENAAKRQKVEVDDEERELERLRQDGQRRRRERAEMLRRQAEEEERLAQQQSEDGPREESKEAGTNGSMQRQVQDIDRVIKSRFPQEASTEHLSKNRVEDMFARFGAIEGVTLREKKVKVDGEKHRKVYMTVAVIFESIVGAHAAIADFAEVAKHERGDWKLFEAPEWASGHAPECIPQPQGRQPQPESRNAATPGSAANGDADDVLMIRLKNAEKKRREDKKRREEAAAAATVNNESAAPPSVPQRKAPSFATFKAKTAPALGFDDAERKREAEKKRLAEEMRREEEEEDRRAAATGGGVVA